jgi:hypothetical protein
MKQCLRLVAIFAITTVVVFTFSYTSSPHLMSKEVEKEFIQTLEDAARGLGRRLHKDDIQKSHDLLTRVDSVQAMGRKMRQEKTPPTVEYVKATKNIDKVRAEYRECEWKLNISQRKSKELAETLRATEVILEALKEEEDDADYDEDEYDITEKVDD